MQIKTLNLKENEENLYGILNEHQDKIFNRGNREIDYSFACFDENEYVGGITGRLWHDELHISLLGVLPSGRGKGFAQSLMATIEEAAIKDDAKVITVTTQDFQAIDFYLSCGYEVFGTLDDCPFEGTKRYYLKKLVK